MKQSRLFNYLIIITLMLPSSWHATLRPMAGAALLMRLPDMIQAAQTLSMAMATAVIYYHQRSQFARALQEKMAPAALNDSQRRNEHIPLFPSVKVVESYQSSYSRVSHTASQSSGQQPDNNTIATGSLSSPDLSTIEESPAPCAQTFSNPQPSSQESASSLATAYASLFNPDNLKTYFPPVTPHYIPPSFCERTGLQPYWEARLVNRQLSPLEQELNSFCQQSATNLMLVQHNKAYAESVGQRLLDFFHLLCATHHTDLIVRIKSRLLLPCCIMEPPWGTRLFDAAYGLMCEYFTPTGALKSTAQSDNAIPFIRYFLDHIIAEGQREWRAQQYGLTTLVGNGTQRTLLQKIGWNIGTFFTYPHFRVMQQRIAAHQENIQLLEFIDLCEKGDIGAVLPHYCTLSHTRPIIQEIFQYYFGHSYDADGLRRTSDPYYTALTPQDRATLQSDSAQLISFNHVLHLRAVCIETMQQRWNLGQEHAAVLYELLDDQGTILHDANVLLERVEQLCACDNKVLPLFYLPNGVLKDLQHLERAQQMPMCSALLEDQTLSSLRLLINKAILAEYEQHNEAASHFLECFIHKIEKMQHEEKLPLLQTIPHSSSYEDLVFFLNPTPPTPPPPPPPQQQPPDPNDPDPNDPKKSKKTNKRPGSKKSLKKISAALKAHKKELTSKEWKCVKALWRITREYKWLGERVADSLSEQEIINKILKHIRRLYLPSIPKIGRMLSNARFDVKKLLAIAQRVNKNITQQTIENFIPKSFSFQHIFNLDCVKNLQNIITRFSGLHIDYKNILQLSGIFGISKVKEVNEAYDATISFLGLVKNSTFVPPSWSYEQFARVIINSIHAAEKIIFEGNKMVIWGREEGFLVKTVIEAGGRIVTAHLVLE